MRNKLLFSLLALGLLLAPFVGVSHLDPSSLFDPDSLDYRIFVQLRLPRILLAFFAGGVLALSGLVFQILFRNALMTPYTLGVSSGAVLGAGIAIKMGISLSLFGFSAVMLFGSFGALFTVFLLLFLARFLHRAEHESLLLLGIALSFFYTSALTVLFYLSSYIETHQILRFTMGSLSVVGFKHTVTTLFLALLLLAVVYAHRYSLELLGISDEHAALKGVNTRQTLYLLLGTASVSVGILVSIIGPIGFVGLVVPHMARKIFKKSASRLLLPVFLLGGFFLLGCDTLSRAITLGSEIPIGVVTAFIGGPFFIYLILTRR